MNRYHTKAEREHFLAEYRASGKTQRAFSEANGISVKTLSRWLCESKPKPLKFKPIGKINAPLSLAEIILPNAIKIRLPIEAEKISTIAQELLACK